MSDDDDTNNEFCFMTEEFAHEAPSWLPSTLINLFFPLITEKIIPLLPIGMINVEFNNVHILISPFMKPTRNTSIAKHPFRQLFCLRKRLDKFISLF